MKDKSDYKKKEIQKQEILLLEFCKILKAIKRSKRADHVNNVDLTCFCCWDDLRWTQYTGSVVPLAMFKIVVTTITVIIVTITAIVVVVIIISNLCGCPCHYSHNKNDCDAITVILTVRTVIPPCAWCR